MKILYLVTDDWYFLSHRLPLAVAAREHGFEVTVVTAPGPGVGEIEAHGLTHRPFAFGRTTGAQLLNAARLSRLTRLYREERPDLVHHVSFLPIFYGSLAARRAGVRGVVNAVTGLGHAFVEGPPGRRALRWAVERAYRIAFERSGGLGLFQNGEDRDHFVARGLVSAARAVVVPGSGVDLGRFPADQGANGSADEPPVVLHPSRMLWTKGVGDSVEASRRLKAAGVDHRLVLAGRTHASNPESIPETTLRGWEAEGACTWLGHADDMPALYKGSTVVCLPSRYREGIPMALLEAAAAERPIVTTDVPGCREAVEHGSSGLLVPPGAPDRLADSIARLLAEPPLRRRLASAARRRAAERFSVELVVERTLAVYDGLLAQPAH